MPKISPNYRLPTPANLDIFRILEEFVSYTFTSGDVAALFNVTTHDGCTRLLKLRRWRLIQVVGRKNGLKAYELTPWGREFLEGRLQDKEGEKWHQQRELFSTQE